MNSSNFILTGGYPLKAERLQELQTAFSVFNALGALAGNLTIISGCTLTGSIVGNGFVYINGELLDFREATVTPSSTVIIIDEAVNRGFKNGSVKQVHTIRYATFGTAETSWLWSTFKQLDPIVSMMAKIQELEKKTSIFQPGGVVFPWFKPLAAIPAGFQEVTDIRGRTIIGYDPSQPEFNAIGKKAGAKNKTLSIAEMPEHDHSTDPFAGTSGGAGSIRAEPWEGVSGGGSKTGKTGDGQSFSILNPYVIAAYIEYIG